MSNSSGKSDENGHSDPPKAILDACQAIIAELRREATHAKHLVAKHKIDVVNATHENRALQSQVRLLSVAAAKAKELQLQLQGVHASIPRHQLQRAVAEAGRARAKAAKLHDSNTKLERGVTGLRRTIEQQRIEIAELKLRLRSICKSARVLGGEQVVRQIQGKSFRDRVCYEAVSAEMAALEGVFDAVDGHSRCSSDSSNRTGVGSASEADEPNTAGSLLGSPVAGSRARASTMLEQAAAMSHPDQRRQFRSAAQALRQSNTPHSDKRSHIASKIRDRLNGVESGPAAADETALRPSVRTRRISQVEASMQGLQDDTATLFAAGAKTRLPIMDGWLAQSIAVKMKQSRLQDRRIAALKQQVLAKDQDLNKLRRQLHIQQNVLQAFVEERHVCRTAAQLVTTIVEAVEERINRPRRAAHTLNTARGQQLPTAMCSKLRSAGELSNALTELGPSAGSFKLAPQHARPASAAASQTIARVSRPGHHKKPSPAESPTSLMTPDLPAMCSPMK